MTDRLHEMAATDAIEAIGRLRDTSEDRLVELHEAESTRVGGPRRTVLDAIEERMGEAGVGPTASEGIARGPRGDALLRGETGVEAGTDPSDDPEGDVADSVLPFDISEMTATDAIAAITKHGPSEAELARLVDLENGRAPEPRKPLIEWLERHLDAFSALAPAAGTLVLVTDAQGQTHEGHVTRELMRAVEVELRDGLGTRMLCEYAEERKPNTWREATAVSRRTPQETGEARMARERRQALGVQRERPLTSGEARASGAVHEVAGAQRREAAARESRAAADARKAERDRR